MFENLRPSIIGSIFRREMLDIFRDRRTVFMMILFPMMLYPLIGVVISNLLSTYQESARRVVVVGSEALPEAPALLNAEKNRFAKELFRKPDDVNRLEVEAVAKDSPWADETRRSTLLRERISDVVVIVPEDAQSKLAEGKVVDLEIVYNSADDRGMQAYNRVGEIVSRWNELVLIKRLKADDKPSDYATPVKEQVRDVATAQESSSQVWARMLPFLLVLMSLTGAFYPAIDLCAGEKERGTMETLLISPARRSEIVMAKFLTILTSSLVTAGMNLLSLGVTSSTILKQLGDTAKKSAEGGSPMASLTLPTPGTIFIAFLVLIPIAAFLSAICLALAVIARSTKEGQYYLTPVIMAAFPLTYMTLVPGVELTPLYALVPLTGTCLLLKSMLAGRMDQALPFVLPVLLPTAAYAWMALRWAVSQFESETVLFREAERFDLKSWVLWQIRHKSDRPTADQAALCFVLMLVAGWFLGPAIASAVSPEGSISGWSMVLTQIFVIGMPSVVLALFLARSPRKVLRLQAPIHRRYLMLGLAFPLAMHPLITELYAVVDKLFPMTDTMKKLFEGLTSDDPLWLSLLAVAVAPGICEELAFRGWIFSGLRTENKPWATIVISSVLFGVMHVLLSAYQQFFHATVLGLVLGLLALRSGSLFPSVIMHVVNNAMAVLFGLWVKASPGSAGLLFSDPKGMRYHWPFVLLAVPLVAYLLRECFRLPAAATDVPEDDRDADS